MRITLLGLASVLLSSCFVPYSHEERRIDMAFAGQAFTGIELPISSDPPIKLQTQGCGPSVYFGTPPVPLILEHPERVSVAAPQAVLVLPGGPLAPERLERTSRPERLKLWFRVGCADLEQTRLELGTLMIDGVERRVPPIVFKAGSRTEAGVVRLQGQWWK